MTTTTQLTAQELRIGNWIQVHEFDDTHPWQKGQVSRILPDTVRIFNEGLNVDFNISDYRGIPLIPEILEKAGFSSDSSTRMVTSDYTLWLERRGDRMFLLADDQVVKEVTYLHQLQNLYFALTGEELTIRL